MKNILYTIILSFLFSFSVFAYDTTKFEALMDTYEAGETGIKELKEINHFDFQNWVVEQYVGRSERKTADYGIDGYSFEGTPIQVKQSERVGRNVVDNFETAIRRKRKKEGIIVAFSFTKGAYEEAKRAKLEDGLEIRLVTVKKLLDNFN